MAPRIPARSTNPPPLSSSVASAGVFHWAGGKVKTLSVRLTPVGRISGVSNSSLVHVVRLFLAPVTRNDLARQNKATCRRTFT